NAKIYWIDITDEKLGLPYDSNLLEESRKILKNLDETHVSSSVLPDTKSIFDSRTILRFKDFIQLFDTTPDLTGNDLDVSRFIRENDDLDVNVYWRESNEWINNKPGQNVTTPSSDEICSVPLFKFRDFVSKKKDVVNVWRWNPLDHAWNRVRAHEIFAGNVILLDTQSGGYDPEIGWSSDSSVKVQDLSTNDEYQAMTEEGAGDDHMTFLSGIWMTLPEHITHVANEADELLARLENLNINQRYKSVIKNAALHHDIGKAHTIFQETMLRKISDAEKSEKTGQIWAKSPHYCRHSRKYFRHELASAMALLQNKKLFEDFDDQSFNLMLYLVAAHHGRIRLAIRSLPDEIKPPENKRFAMGVWDEEVIPQVMLQSDMLFPETKISLDSMEIGLSQDGSQSWMERMIRLRDEKNIGPIKLSFFETILRVADIRASIKERTEGQL
ncbi:MAG: CRISPR-associated endonuclease Cas3'', partial [Candidatus Schekmanbacteria bacterium RBG_13_48_7]